MTPADCLEMRHINKLLNLAEKKACGQQISFCGHAEDWLDCITIEGNCAMLWFNVGKYTMVVTIPINEE